jgi:hypothetical protein
MRHARDWFLLRSITAMFVCGSMLLSSCQSLELIDEGIFTSDEPPTVRALARDIDSLERHIDTYGSVTLKQPDVWGQARLTLIRDEFEQTMKADLGTFKATLQGTFSASDQAYFLNALALSAAASGTQQVVRPAPTAVANVSSATGSSAPPSGTNINPPNLPTFPGLTESVGAFGGITRNAPIMPGFLGFGANATIALEPTVIEEQKARFLNALHELRRISEGDDTADSPGYSLNLIRLPVSVFPGKRTDVGYGAEMTLTVTPQLSDELLPMTFRNLVLNDLVDQIGFPTTQFVNNPDNGVYFDPRRATDLDELLQLIDDVTFNATTPHDEVQHLKALRQKLSLQPIFARPEWEWVDDYVKRWDDAGKKWPELESIRTTTGEQEKQLQAGIQDLRGSLERALGSQKRNEGLRTLFQKPSFTAADKNEIDGIGHPQIIHPRPFQSVLVPATKSRRARMPFPPTEIPDVYGDSLIFQVASRIYNVFSKEQFAYPCPSSQKILIHFPDVQGYLQEELAGAQKLLQEPTNVELWGFCNQALVVAVRSHATESIRVQRDQFLALLAQKTNGSAPVSPTIQALSWAWIVESALLTDQLMRDMKEAASAKGCAPPGPDPDQPWPVEYDFFKPNPQHQAREAFKQYVSIRWPIHVFALDPVQQEQNIGSTFSGSREMQLALSVGFVNGQISAQDLMQYSRRVEFDAQTIDLNGTTVGFSNGENTFGWRFYPRFQTPEIQSNLMAFIQTVFTGGPNRNELLHERRLEPGIRECDAIVIMPSFVPYVSVDVSSNWFSLVNPRKKHLNAAYAMRLSRQVKEIQTCKSMVADGHCYRDGDVSRLYAKAQQLETRLPFQTMTVQVPYENTLGGFGMFNTGITDLAPELTGWYGAPSINPTASTTVFLVGDHFSVLQTAVIAGGQQLPTTAVQLLSRQVLQATIPGNTITTGTNGEQFVDVQLATPYGVTQHLMIPVCASTTAGGGNSTAAVPIAPAWSPASISLAFQFGGLGIVPPTSTTTTTTLPIAKPPSLLVVPGSVDPTKWDTVTVTIKLPAAAGGGKLTLPPSTYDGQQGYPISGAALSAQLFPMVGAYYGPTALPPSTLNGTTTFVFSSSTGGFAPVTVDSGNSLAISWVQAVDTKPSP